MNTPSTMEPEVALKLAHAIKALDFPNTRLLLQVLHTNLGQPLSEQNLALLTPKSWRSMLSKLNGDFSRKQIDTSYAALLSGPDQNENQLVTASPIEGHKLTVAVASNANQLLDGHFGSCLRILFYDVNGQEHRLVKVQEIDSDAKGEERTRYLVSLIEGCDILFTLSIGGAAAAKVTRAGIHPIKVQTPLDANTKLDELSSAIKQGVAPWLSRRLIDA
ncbi:NifB/NifX family molybdenum-iron cluster-binding protein [Vibrio sp. FNV 38]|nr:NifB/NifX family molybdenum-iron cluster-binding protein [Vibrio sp. FNV 38]